MELLWLLLILYFLPTIIAACRSHHSGVAVFALNLLLGWTFLGWVWSLVWSLSYVIPRTALQHEAVQRNAAAPRPAALSAAPEARTIAGVIAGCVVVGGVVGVLAGTRSSPKPQITITAVTPAHTNTVDQSGWQSASAKPPKASPAVVTTATIRTASIPPKIADIEIGQTTQAQRRAYVSESLLRVKGKMADPSSVVFKDTFFSGAAGLPLTCGWVNGKNALDRFIGFKRFIATGGEKGIVLIDDGSNKHWILGERLPNAGKQDVEQSWKRFCTAKQ